MYSMEQMRSGQWFLPGGEEANAQHARTFELMRQVNALGNTDRPRATELLRQVFSNSEHVPGLFAPLHVEFGVNTRFGKGCFMNFNCVILDIAEVTIGDGSMFGPGCQLITVGHPVEDAVKRAEGWEIAKPIRIGKDCWFGAGAMVMPGVTVGDRCVVAAGTVVTKDVPDDCLVAGVPSVVKRRFGKDA